MLTPIFHGLLPRRRNRRSGPRCLCCLVLILCTFPSGQTMAEIKRTVDDELRLKSLRFRLEDWREAATRTSEQGLDFEALLVPDLLAYKTVTSYLTLRKAGKSHGQALASLARSLPRWKRYEKKAAFVLTMRNPEYRLGKTKRRIYTLQADIRTRGFSVTSEKNRRIAHKLSGKPSGLRSAKLQTKKFWSTADGGVTRRPRSPDDPRLLDPLSLGRKALVSKPFSCWVIESKPVVVELMVSRSKTPNTGRSFSLKLPQWKRYEGPFEKDTLDLNDRRPWRELRDITIPVRPPSGGWHVSDAFEKLLGEVRAEAKKKPGARKPAK